ncbi:MAG: hypothetical protein JO184_05850 [Gammaproteobacteria bacterium]|nr:hypothetical protein [Gammaproteobacteria bacterium]
MSDPNTTSNANAFGTSIDDLGIVGGGYTLTNGALNATLWVYGQQVPLGTLGTGPTLGSVVQWPVKNVLGLVSGISYTDQVDPNKEAWSCSVFLGGNPNNNVCLGFVWDPVTKKMRPLRTLGGTNGFATGTNNLGETVGWAENTVHDPTCVLPQVLQFKPVVWGPGHDEIRALPLIGADGSGAATALNDRGQIVGISGDCDVAVGATSARHAVLWDNGVAFELKNPNHAPYWNTPMMINQWGEVVGFAGVPNDPNGLLTQPFFWSRKHGWVFLPLLPGDITSTASSINNHGVIVGYSSGATGPNHPWVMHGVHGVPRNLNDLIEPGSGITGPIFLAFDVNDRGEISGTTVTGQAIIATPLRQD